MKRTVNLFLIALICISFGIDANAADGDRLGGIRVGYQQSGLYKDGDIALGTDPLQSFYVGFNRDNKLIPLLHLGTGLEYSQKGLKSSDDSKYVMHSLGVPLNLKLKLGPVFVLTGIAPSFVMSEKYIDSDGTKTTPDDKANVFDAPFFVGGGLKFLVFSIEARYHWGLLETSGLGYMNKYLQIGLGVSF